jgi:hypothetical protein
MHELVRRLSRINDILVGSEKVVVVVATLLLVERLRGFRSLSLVFPKGLRYRNSTSRKGAR